MPRSGGVELGERRQPVLGELARLQTADRRDERAVGHALRALANHVLHLGDRECGLDRAGLVARAAADQLYVEVVVDHPGDDRAAAQIDRIGAAARRAGRVADFDEAAVGDAYLRHDGTLRVHRVDLAVGEEQQASGRTGLSRHECRQQRQDREVPPVEAEESPSSFRTCFPLLTYCTFPRIPTTACRSAWSGSAVMFRIAQW